MVAVPALLADHADIEEQLERLEVHYLANPEGHLHFVLLTDWPDASAERMRELPGKTGAGLDPCAALQTHVELEPGERTEVVFLLGQGTGLEEARSLIERYRALSCDAVLREVQEHWEQILGTVLLSGKALVPLSDDGSEHRIQVVLG